MKICMIGAGGIGTHLLPLLINIISDDDEIFVMDGDRFEEKNLDRQRFDKSLLDTNKAIAMAKMYGINPLPMFLRDVDQLKGYDFVICCPDNNKARVVALDACKAYGIKTIISGNEARSANAIVWDGNHKFNPVHRYPDLLDPDEEVGISCHERTVEVPQTALANCMAASLSVALFMYWTETVAGLPDNWDYIPIEYYWTPSAIITTKTGDILTDGTVRK